MDNIFKKSNILINHPNKYKALSAKYLNKIIQYVSHNDDVENLEMPFNIFKDINGNSKVTQLKSFKVFEDIAKPIHIIKPSDEEFEIINAISCPRLDKINKTVSFEIPQAYKKYMFVGNHSENNNKLASLGYTNLSFESILKLSSKHDIKGYELFSSRCFASKQFSISTNELLFILGIENNFYESYYQFNQKILNPMQERINAVCTDFKIHKYEPIKNNAGKVAKIELICEKIKLKEQTIILPANVQKTIELEPIQEEIQEPAPSNYAPWFNQLMNWAYKDTKATLVQWYNQSEQRKEQLKGMFKCIKDDYLAKQKPCEPAKLLKSFVAKNSFYEEEQAPAPIPQQITIEQNEEDEVIKAGIAKAKEELESKQIKKEQETSFYDEIMKKQLGEENSVLGKIMCELEKEIPPNQFITWVKPAKFYIEEGQLRYYFSDIF